MKKFLAPLKTWILGVVAATILALIFKSLRIRYQGFERLSSSDQKCILAFWHGRILMLPGAYNRNIFARTKRTISVLISQHGDGRLIANAVKLLGIRSVAGSSSKGAVKGVLNLLTEAEKGFNCGITPDGPRGPVHEVKPGIIHLAKVTGIPIYTLTYSAKNVWRFGSWDKMILPKPFSKAIALLGEPLFVPADADDAKLEELRIELQTRLRELTESADNHEYNS